MSVYSDVITYAVTGTTVGIVGGTMIRRLVPRPSDETVGNLAMSTVARIGLNAAIMYFLTQRAGVYGVSDPYLQSRFLMVAMLQAQPDLFKDAATVVNAGLDPLLAPLVASGYATDS